LTQSGHRSLLPMIRTLALSLFVGYTTTPLRRTSGLVLTRNPEVIG
jgi:hypothetical protein